MSNITKTLTRIVSNACDPKECPPDPKKKNARDMGQFVDSAKTTLVAIPSDRLEEFEVKEREIVVECKDIKTYKRIEKMLTLIQDVNAATRKLLYAGNGNMEHEVYRSHGRNLLLARIARNAAPNDMKDDIVAMALSGCAAGAGRCGEFTAVHLAIARALDLQDVALFMVRDVKKDHTFPLYVLLKEDAQEREKQIAELTEHGNAVLAGEKTLNALKNKYGGDFRKSLEFKNYRKTDEYQNYKNAFDYLKKLFRECAFVGDSRASLTTACPYGAVTPEDADFPYAVEQVQYFHVPNMEYARQFSLGQVKYVRRCVEQAFGANGLEKRLEEEQLDAMRKEEEQHATRGTTLPTGYYCKSNFLDTLLKNLGVKGYLDIDTEGLSASEYPQAVQELAKIKDQVAEYQLATAKKSGRMYSEHITSDYAITYKLRGANGEILSEVKTHMVPEWLYAEKNAAISRAEASRNESKEVTQLVASKGIAAGLVPATLVGMAPIIKEKKLRSLQSLVTFKDITTGLGQAMLVAMAPISKKEKLRPLQSYRGSGLSPSEISDLDAGA